MHHKFSGAVTGGLILSSYCDNPFEYFRKEIALHTEKDLLANNDEENRDNFDTDVGILELFGKETLENLQSIIAKVTGLGLVTADFRGEPLTTILLPLFANLQEKEEIMGNYVIFQMRLVLSALRLPENTASIFVHAD